MITRRKLGAMLGALPFLTILGTSAGANVTGETHRVRITKFKFEPSDLVIAAGDHPSPEREDDLVDGLFTAIPVHGRSALQGAYVTSHCQVQARVKPHRPDTELKMNTCTGTLERQGDTWQPQYHSEGITSTRRSGSSLGEEIAWEVSLEVWKNQVMITNGNMVLALPKMVRFVKRVHVCCKATVVGGFILKEK